jgi:hypothetical protein
MNRQTIEAVQPYLSLRSAIANTSIAKIWDDPLQRVILMEASEPEQLKTLFFPKDCTAFDLAKLCDHTGERISTPRQQLCNIYAAQKLSSQVFIGSLAKCICRAATICDASPNQKARAFVSFQSCVTILNAEYGEGSEYGEGNESAFGGNGSYAIAWCTAAFPNMDGNESETFAFCVELMGLERLPGLNDILAMATPTKATQRNLEALYSTGYEDACRAIFPAYLLNSEGRLNATSGKSFECRTNSWAAAYVAQNTLLPLQPFSWYCNAYGMKNLLTYFLPLSQAIKSIRQSRTEGIWQASSEEHASESQHFEFVHAKPLEAIMRLNSVMGAIGDMVHNWDIQSLATLMFLLCDNMDEEVLALGEDYDWDIWDEPSPMFHLTEEALSNHFGSRFAHFDGGEISHEHRLIFPSHFIRDFAHLVADLCTKLLPAKGAALCDAVVQGWDESYASIFKLHCTTDRLHTAAGEHGETMVVQRLELSTKAHLRWDDEWKHPTTELLEGVLAKSVFHQISYLRSKEALSINSGVHRIEIAFMADGASEGEKFAARAMYWMLAVGVFQASSPGMHDYEKQVMCNDYSREMPGWGLTAAGLIFQATPPAMFCCQEGHTMLSTASRNSYGAGFGFGDLIGIEVDMTRGIVRFFRNGTLIEGCEITGVPVDGPLYVVARMPQHTCSAAIGAPFQSV